MANPIEWKEADRVESVRVPGAAAKLVVNRRVPGKVATWDDATPADLASALDAIPETDRAAVLQAFGADLGMRAAWRAALVESERDEARRERDALRTELATVRQARDEARKERDEARAALDARTNETDALALQLIGTELARDAASKRAGAALAERDEARKERDALRNELRAREWLEGTGLVVVGVPGLIFVGAAGGVAVAYATYAGAARALGWEG